MAAQKTYASAMQKWRGQLKHQKHDSSQLLKRSHADGISARACERCETTHRKISAAPISRGLAAPTRQGDSSLPQREARAYRA